jgi:putative transcriptional regulator
MKEVLPMSIRYKIDVLSALKEAGYNTNRIRKEKLLSESTVQKLRQGEYVSMDNLDTLCKLLNCQPGDIMEYVEE